MNERETERRLRGWLDAQSSPAVPDELRRAVASIPATIPAGWPDRLAGALGWRPAAVPRPVWLLLAAALLLALASTTAFVGSRLLEGRPLPPQDPNAVVPTAAADADPDAKPDAEPDAIAARPRPVHRPLDEARVVGASGSLVGVRRIGRPRRVRRRLRRAREPAQCRPSRLGARCLLLRRRRELGGDAARDDGPQLPGLGSGGGGGRPGCGGSGDRDERGRGRDRRRGGAARRGWLRQRRGLGPARCLVFRRTAAPGSGRHRSRWAA